MSIYELKSIENNLTHRILCGDSTKISNVAELLDYHIPVLLLTDPPYGVSYDPSWRDEDLNACNRPKQKIENDDIYSWAEVWQSFPGQIAYIWHAAKHTVDVAQSLNLADYEIINQIIWAKQHFAISRGNYHWQHEPCWYARRKGKGHNWQGSRKESTLWTIPNLAHPNFGGSTTEDCRTNHPTQKPLELMMRPILNNSDIGEGVYDPFAGSFTTLIACEMLQRRFFGLEIDPDYCHIGIERWVNYMSKNHKSFTITHNGKILQSN
jgi:DNA modification methylase